MTVEQAVKQRIERFNRLWTKATGHSFEEEPALFESKFKEEQKAWEPKLLRFVHDCGFNSEMELKARMVELEVILEESETPYDELLDERDELAKYREFLNQAPKLKSSLYWYEMHCIEQALAIVKYFTTKGGKHFYNWLKYDYDAQSKQKNLISLFKFIDVIKEIGFEGWEEGHSGNSAFVSMCFADCLLNCPEDFQYLHGALAALVGDTGYYDDRSDLPERI